MNTLLRPLGRHGLKKAVIVFVVFGAFFFALFCGLEHSISILSKAGVSDAHRRGFDSEILLLRLTASGVALCGLALGVCMASVYFLWRTGLRDSGHDDSTQMKYG